MANPYENTNPNRPQSSNPNRTNPQPNATPTTAGKKGGKQQQGGKQGDKGNCGC